MSLYQALAWPLVDIALCRGKWYWKRLIRLAREDLRGECWSLEDQAWLNELPDDALDKVFDLCVNDPDDQHVLETIIYTTSTDRRNHV